MIHPSVSRRCTPGRDYRRRRRATSIRTGRAWNRWRQRGRPPAVAGQPGLAGGKRRRRRRRTRCERCALIKSVVGDAKFTDQLLARAQRPRAAVEKDGMFAPLDVERRIAVGRGVHWADDEQVGLQDNRPASVKDFLEFRFLVVCWTFGEGPGDDGRRDAVSERAGHCRSLAQHQYHVCRAR